jgi:YggT family protein
MYIVFVLAEALDGVLQIIEFLIIAQVVASWLVAFGVVNMRNRGVSMVIDSLDRITNPILRPLRRIIPPMGGLDISPLVLFVLIDYVIRPLIRHYAIMLA